MKEKGVGGFKLLDFSHTQRQAFIQSLGGRGKGGEGP